MVTSSKLTNPHLGVDLFQKTAPLKIAGKGWNNRINNILGGPNPELKVVILCLKKEAKRLQ